jgi:hypothetical protein
MGSQKDQTSRRAILLGLAGFGLTGAAPKSLPNHLFSLTVWASGGPMIDFLLLNISEQPLELVWTAPPAFEVLVRDEEGWILSDDRSAPTGSWDGFITAVAPASITLADVRRKARRLRAWKAFKGSVTSETLRRLIEGRLREPLDPDRLYALTFRMRVPVIDPASGMQLATVQSRSLCTWSFEAGRLQTVCTGPRFTDMP